MHNIKKLYNYYDCDEDIVFNVICGSDKYFNIKIRLEFTLLKEDYLNFILFVQDVIRSDDTYIILIDGLNIIYTDDILIFKKYEILLCSIDCSKFYEDIVLMFENMLTNIEDDFPHW